MYPARPAARLRKLSLLKGEGIRETGQFQNMEEGEEEFYSK
jgi:hypothetical protein